MKTDTGAFMHPEVSVVIPAYNAARFISDAIDSALSQSFKPAEVIVVDDGSTDQTRSIVEGYGDKVRCIHQRNAGPATARNTGVREARSEWIAFLDSDDYWDARHLEMMVQNAEAYREAVLVYCGKKIVDVDGNERPDYPRQTMFPSGWIFSEMFRANYISSTSVVFVKKTIVLDLGGFNRGLRNAEDYDLWMRIAAIAPIRGVPEYTVYYRVHDNNLTRQTMSALKGHMTALNSALALMESGKVDGRNNPDSLGAHKAMVEYYGETALGLFHLEEYGELRKLGHDALQKRYLSSPLILRWLLSFMPPAVLKKVRELYRNANL
jgi:glycosyltransferase involved in cell wall biosynthesis